MVDDARQHGRIQLKNRPQINKRFFENVETAVNNSASHYKQRWPPCNVKSLCPIINKDGHHVMLNLRRESQGLIHSFKLSRENINMEHLPCDGV